MSAHAMKPAEHTKLSPHCLSQQEPMAVPACRSARGGVSDAQSGTSRDASLRTLRASHVPSNSARSSGVISAIAAASSLSIEAAAAVSPPAPAASPDMAFTCSKGSARAPQRHVCRAASEVVFRRGARFVLALVLLKSC